MKSVYIPYRQENHGDFDAEWPIQRKISGWWYITGYFNETGQREPLYSYQFTTIKPNIKGISPYILQLALTNIQTGEHHFQQRVTFWNKDIYIDENTVNYMSLARLERRQNEMGLTAKTDLFEFNLTLDKGKGAFWHGDDGVLVMGSPSKPAERTVYYSYTNMPTRGEVMIHIPGGENKQMQVTGKSWFDRQWGPYHLIDSYTHWEWFSLRFFDDEEVMLFAFPQCNYFDGTYIQKDKTRKLVRNYTYTPHRFVKVNDISYSHGWDLEMPGVKEEKYILRPLIEGQMNLGYFELLAEIVNPSGERVGLCVVELLPGARNPDKKLGLDLFKKV